MIASVSDKVASFFSEVGYDPAPLEAGAELVIDRFEHQAISRHSMRVTICQCVIEDLAVAA
jgi:hypothetical protein